MRIRSYQYHILVVVGLCLGILAVATGQYRSSGQDSVRDFRQDSVGLGDLPQPTPANGSGVLGSSMYSGGPPRGSGGYHSGGGGSGGVSFTTVEQPMTQTRVYDPMTTVGVTQATPGTSALMVYMGEQDSNQIESATNALSQSADAQAIVTRPAVTSLAPAQDTEYRAAMLRGEEALKDKNYDEAMANFKIAETESGGLEESLLAQVLASLGSADGDYDDAAAALGKTLRVFPALPMARVHPKDFFADGEYDRIITQLTDHVKSNPNDASAFFLLGYLEWCDGDVPEARTAVKEALDCANDAALKQSIDLLIEGAGMAREHLAAAAPMMQDAMTLPTVGLSLQLPEGFTLGRLKQINRALEAHGGTPQAPQRITLNLFPVSDTLELKELMDSTMQMDLARGIDLIGVDDEAKVDFLDDDEGYYRALRCEYGGNTFAIVRFCFTRDIAHLDGSTQRMAYVLTMGVMEDQADVLLPAVAAVARSIELTDVQRPIDLPVPDTGHVVTDQQWGVSIRQPDGWAGALDERGFTMGQFDCLVGGTVTPRVELIVAEVDDDHSPKSIIEKAIAAQAEEGYTMTVISDDPAQMAGHDGHQFVATKESADGSDTWVEIGRVILVTKSDETEEMFALVVRCEHATPEQATAIMDAIAPTVTLTD